MTEKENCTIEISGVSLPEDFYLLIRMKAGVLMIKN